MTLRVPLTLTIIPALTVSIGSQHFAIPRSAIEEIVRANGESVTLEHLGGAGVATIRGRRVPRSLARRPSSASTARSKREDRTLIVLRPAGGDVYALSVDRIHDHEELVVKPAAPAVMATGLYAGTTLADDGSPILLFDPAGHRRGRRRQARGAGARRAHRRRSGRRRLPGDAGAAVPRARRRTPRASAGGRRPDRRGRRGAASSRRAGQLRVQVGEAILPLAGATAAELGDGKVRLFRLNDGSTRSAMRSPKSSISRPSTTTSSMPSGRARSAACR